MTFIKFIYLSIYNTTRKDKNWSKLERTKYLIYIVLMMICSSIFFIIFGALNIKSNNFKNLSFFALITYLCAEGISSLLYRKIDESEFIKEGVQFDKRKQKRHLIFGYLIYLFSFILMVVSAILMSFLLSLHD